MANVGSSTPCLGLFQNNLMTSKTKRLGLAAGCAVAAIAWAAAGTAAAAPWGAYERMHNAEGPMSITATGKSSHSNTKTACAFAPNQALASARDRLARIEQANSGVDIQLRNRQIIDCTCSDNPDAIVIANMPIGTYTCEATVRWELWAVDKRERGRGTLQMPEEQSANEAVKEDWGGGGWEESEEATMPGSSEDWEPGGEARKDLEKAVEEAFFGDLATSRGGKTSEDSVAARTRRQTRSNTAWGGAKKRFGTARPQYSSEGSEEYWGVGGIRENLWGL